MKPRMLLAPLLILGFLIATIAGVWFLRSRSQPLDAKLNSSGDIHQAIVTKQPAARPVVSLTDSPDMSEGTPLSAAPRTSLSRPEVLRKVMRFHTDGAVPARVRPILNLDKTHSIGERTRIAVTIGDQLTELETAALYQYLLTPEPADQPEFALKDAVLTKLEQQQATPADMVAVLTAIYEDKAQHVVMRDYAVQHLREWYSRGDDELKSRIAECLWRATEETDSNIAGTALLALDWLAGGDDRADLPGPRDARVVPARRTTSPSAIDDARTAQAALRMATDPHSDPLSRMTAVQICARLEVKEAIPVIRQLAQDIDSFPLRLAAIAALGELGDSADLVFLQQIETSGERSLLPAAQQARQRLQARTDKTPPAS